jgi:hypothetical protein
MNVSLPVSSDKPNLTILALTGQLTAKTTLGKGVCSARLAARMAPIA